MKFMVRVMCAMSSHFTRQIRWVAIRAAVNDVLQGSTWSFTAFHKSVPTSFRREPLKRNHGNYMFAQGKWNRTFPSVFSSLLSVFFLFFSFCWTLFILLLWPSYDVPHPVIFQQSWKDFLSSSSWLRVYLRSCICWHVVPWKNISKAQVRETNLTARCLLQNVLLLKAFSGCAHYIISWNEPLSHPQ